MFNLLSGEYSVFRIARADFPAAARHSVFFLPFFARTAILGKTTKVRTIMPNFDPLTYRYSSRRNVVYAKNGVCCTSVPLGAQVGLDVLKNGGNAVDAAVA